MESGKKLLFAVLLLAAGVFQFGAGLEYLSEPLDHVKVVRQLVHASDWSAVGTISSEPSILGFPMVQLISVADGVKNALSTGNIYFMLSPADLTTKDFLKDNRVTFLFSSEQQGVCSRGLIDPMDPRCPRAQITGSVIKMDPNLPEYKLALDAFISRHPTTSTWIQEKNHFLCKLDIKNILLMDWIGLPKNIPVDQYFKLVGV